MRGRSDVALVCVSRGGAIGGCRYWLWMVQVNDGRALCRAAAGDRGAAPNGIENDRAEGVRSARARRVGSGAGQPATPRAGTRDPVWRSPWRRAPMPPPPARRRPRQAVPVGVLFLRGSSANAPSNSGARTRPSSRRARHSPRTWRAVPIAIEAGGPRLPARRRVVALVRAKTLASVLKQKAARGERRATLAAPASLSPMCPRGRGLVARRPRLQ